MSKLSKSGLLAILFTLTTVTIVYAVSVNWGAANHPIYDETGVGGTVLADGDIVQLIWDQSANGIDLPTSNGLPSGDDQLLDSSTIGFGAFANTGKFSKNINTLLVGVGSHIYVRAWNDNTLANATYYGNSPVAIVSSNPAYTFDSTAAGGFATTNSIAQLAVTLESFEATCQGDWILLVWETVSELNNRGFNLWRGTLPIEPDTQLNDVLIPSQSQGNPNGFIYTWEDHSDVVSGTTYYYWIEDVDVNNVVTRHGPVSAICGVPTAVTLQVMTTSSTRERSDQLSGASLLLVFTVLAIAYVTRKNTSGCGT